MEHGQVRVGAFLPANEDPAEAVEPGLSAPGRVTAITDWATSPIDLRRGNARRLFAQELVTQMASIGSATRVELLTLPLLLFKVAPEPAELDQLTEIARRLGWLEKIDSAREEWRLTESGRAVRRPPSLAIPQVATRILSVADPVRTQARDWLPLIALGVGAVAGAVQGLTTADAVRGTSVAVLVGAVLWQFYGELQIVQAIKGWPRVQHDPACKPLTALYSTGRLVFTLLLVDAAAIAAFALLIFGQWQLGLLVLAIAMGAGLFHLIKWTIPAARMVWEFAGRPPSSPMRWLRRRQPIDAES